MHLVTIAATACALLLSGCGSGGSDDTVDETSLTPLNGAALIEGTTNDSSALETAAEPGDVETDAAGNATETQKADADKTM